MILSFGLFGFYLLGTVAIGLWAARKSRGTEEDFFLAGRGLSAISMALSAVTSGRSAWLIVGASAAAWKMGLSALWLFPGYIAAEALMFVTIGPRLRERSKELGAITLPEVLQGLGRGADGRHGSSKLPIRSVAAIVSCVFLLALVSTELEAGSQTLSVVYSIDGRTAGLLTTAGLVLAYTLLGGYRAVVATDVFQSAFMLFGMVVLAFLGLLAVGGAFGLVEGLHAIDPALTDPVRSGLALFGGLAIGFGSPGNPHILVRHMSLADPRKARPALVIATLWNIVTAAGALLLGLVGRVLYPTTDFLLGEGGEFLYATMADDLSRQYLFFGFEGVLLATLFAAVMATCDSQVLVIASNVKRDLRPGHSAGRPASSTTRRGLLVSRLAVLATMGAAISLAYCELPIVSDLALLSWGALGAAFGPPVIAALYDPRTSAMGIFVGILTGVGVVVLARFSGAAPQGNSINYELAAAFIASLAVTLALRDWRR